ncbi:RNA polymerase recycling motor HelD [Peribacillus sp. SCS-26]|uniref:RNA polymerase recycling motor HelD n=1 Tax=Paraperibacillus marinus TaxID=3115295 RepID=UPI0039060897
MDNTHSEWKSEQDRVDYVRKQIEVKEENLRQHSGTIKQGIRALRENFWEDVTVNLDEPDDVIETQASIKQQVELLSERERSHGLLHEGLKKLSALKKSPYFGRIDFHEDGEANGESLYIGIASLLDESEENFLIYDWRAPVSSLYYDYPPGPAQYQTMDGAITGRLELKRQYVIKNGKIEGLFDTGITIGDRLLQELLGSRSDTNMKSIVATIQKEQNQIIRNEKNKVLVVQGVAGSGKTSAALQRVAYLLYTHRETLHSQNMVLFSPNPLFNSYISTVLPELGEENMRQTTFKQFAESLLGPAFELEDPFDQMEASMSGENRWRLAAISYKSSLDFKDLINNYLGLLGKGGVVFRDITIKNEILIPSEKISDYFYSLDQRIPLPNRMRQTAEWLLGRVMESERVEQEKDWVLEEVQLLDKEDFLEAHRRIQKEKRSFGDHFDESAREEELLRRKVIRGYFMPIKKRVKRLGFANVPETFLGMFEGDAPEVLKGRPGEWEGICSLTLSSIKKRKLLWEDAAPYLYFRDQIIGRRSFSQIRHVFIDEYQDYSPFQADYLKGLFRSSGMTLLGDLNQSIFPGSGSRSLLAESDEGETERIELLRSYRSTREIVEFTRELVENGDRIIPFTREGGLPEMIELSSGKDLYGFIAGMMEKELEQGSETAALICKTEKDARDAYAMLKDRMNIQLMDRHASSYLKGAVILPVYLAKGIEFDSVFIHDASSDAFYKESDRNLFYTACTRAMHKLYMFFVNEPSPFISKMPSSKYILKKI